MRGENTYVRKNLEAKGPLQVFTYVRGRKRGGHIYWKQTRGGPHVPPPGAIAIDQDLFAVDRSRFSPFRAWVHPILLRVTASPAVKSASSEFVPTIRSHPIPRDKFYSNCPSRLVTHFISLIPPLRYSRTSYDQHLLLNTLMNSEKILGIGMRVCLEMGSSSSNSLLSCYC